MPGGSYHGGEPSSGKHSQPAPCGGRREEGPGAVSKEKESHTGPPDSIELRLGFKKAELTWPFSHGNCVWLGRLRYCTRVSSQPGE